jgi:hypothetical protein
MKKLLASVAAVALCAGVDLTFAQNVDAPQPQAQRQKNGAATSQGQAAKPTANEPPPAGAAQSVKTSPECDKLSGKDKDNCIQATPAGPVEMTTGQGSKGKSDTAKERDQDQAQRSNESAAPSQSNDSMGHPDKGVPGAATGQAPQNNKTLSGKNIPEQSKDTVGHPEQRATTGEAAPLKEPGTNRPGSLRVNRIVRSRSGSSKAQPGEELFCS